MLEQPVWLALEILTDIYSQKPTTGFGVNEIYRQTSSKTKDKDRVIKAIGYLKRAKILETRTSPEHTQKEPKFLTPIGHEFAQLIKSVNDYMDSYDKFEQKVRFYYDIPDTMEHDIRINKLRMKGFSHEESIHYS